MNIPKEIRIAVYVLLLILSVQLTGNGVLTILNITTGYERQQVVRAAHIVFGAVYIGVGAVGVYSACRLYRRFRESESEDARGRRRRRRRRK